MKRMGVRRWCSSVSACVFISRLRYACIDCVLHVARACASVVYTRVGIGMLVLLVVFGGMLGFGALFDLQTETARQYGSTYSLVPERISKSAPIVITLPTGVVLEDASSHVTFDPAIDGVWVASERAQTLIYQPHEPLKVDRYYAVALESPDVQLFADFRAVEDPVLEAVFPASDTEADEYSAITMVFNRPMVPLTTLGERAQIDIPITISPPTEGRFRWQSTRTLQFVPDTRLARASTYTVTLGDGMTSVEGVPVPPMTHTFNTRPLRIEGVTQGEVRYNQPIVIRFNQPVDLAATQRHITVERVEGTSRRVVAFEAVYGMRQVFNTETRIMEELEDVSQVWLYQARDEHNRPLLWDFERRYRVTVADAMPLEGALRASPRSQQSVHILDGIVEVSARSDRSNLVESSLFDPTGELVVRFVEDIDLRRSIIRAKGLVDVRYDEACARTEAGKVIYEEPGVCRTEQVLDTLVLTFDADQLGQQETVPISFERMVNHERQVMNARPMSRTITTYPALQVLKTRPVPGTQTGSLTELVLCTNAPLTAHSRETYRDALSASRYMAFSTWGNAYRVGDRDVVCDYGTYRSTIRYGLHPEEQYTLALSLTDHFGQQVAHSLSFTSEKPREEYVRFHNLQNVYNVTPPDRTRLTYAAENMEYLDMVICKMDARTFLERSVEPSRVSEAPSPDTCEAYITDRIELPKRYWVNNYFQVTLAEYVPDVKGQYSVSFTHPLMVRERWDSAMRTRVTERYHDQTFVSVTDLSVAEKRINLPSVLNMRDGDEGGRPNASPALQEVLEARHDLYWVTRMRTLAPVAGATVTTYTRPNRTSGPVTVAQRGVTGWDGVAELPTTERAFGAVVEVGGERAVIAQWSDRLNFAQAARHHEHTYIYTDRPIYRPGHTVYIKGIDRIGYDGGHVIVEGLTAQATVYSSRNEKLIERDVVLSAYGTFAFDVVLPRDAPLGRYRIEVFGQRAFFDVEEYVPAAFKVDVASESDEYIAGDTMQILIDAEYYFGVPVADAEVTYAFSSQDYFFDRYTDERFSFGRGWYYCYHCGFNDAFLFRGSTRTDANGKARIERLLDFAELYGDPDEESSKIFSGSVTIQDASGRSVSGRVSFVVHKGEFYLGVKADPGFVGIDRTVALRAKTVDTLGAPRAQRDIELKVEKVEWNTFRRREVDGGYYYHSEETRTEVVQRVLATDRNGDGSFSHVFTEPGRYELIGRTSDARGNVLTSKWNIFVFGDGAVSVRPTNNHSLELESEQTDVEIGDEPRILVQSPYPRAKALITIERGSVYEYQIVDVTGGLFDHPIPIKEHYSPNVFVNVLLISPDPEVKYGQLEFRVSPNLKRLLIELATNKDTYLPGEDVHVSVSTNTNAGEPIPAEVSLAVVDMSVLALRGNPKKNPLRYFYPGLPHAVVTSSNLRHLLHERDIPDGTKGGDGADPDDLATRKRGVFRDTAFWQANIETNQDGAARASFTLPDNLTTWQIEAVGVTKDTRVGAAYKEFVARKQLMAVPLRPRFVVPGDEMAIGATVFNQTDTTQTFSIEMTSPTLVFLEEPRTDIRLRAGEERVIRFRTRAPVSVLSGSHTFTFSVRTDGYADVVEQTIAITPNDTYEVVASAHMTKQDTAREFVYVPDEVIDDKGEVTIATNATLALFTADALSYLREYPYGCSEQLASKLGGIAVARRAQALFAQEMSDELPEVYFEGAYYHPDEAVRRGLARLYENQVAGGGFAYYPQLRSDRELTIYILETLLRLREAGYTVNEDVLERAIQFVRQTLPSIRAGATDRSWNEHRNRATFAYAVYVLQRADSTRVPNRDTIEANIDLLATDTGWLAEYASPITLAYLAQVTRQGGMAAHQHNALYRALENRLVLDGRGASIRTSSQGRIEQLYETPVKNTALFLQVLARTEREHPMTDALIRWLLQSRSKDGAWGSTHNTLAVVEALTDYVAVQREAEADFELVISLNDAEVARESFTSGSLFGARTTILPIQTFARNTLETITIDRMRRSGPETNLYYDMVFRYFLPVSLLPPRDEGISVQRAYYAREDTAHATARTEARVGEVLKGRMVITVPHEYAVVSVEDAIPAGFELINFSLATEDQTLRDDPHVSRDPRTDTRVGGMSNRIVGPFARVGHTAATFLGLSSRAERGLEVYDTRIASRTAHTRTLPVDFEELRDDRLFLFTERLRPGVYVYEYYVRATTPGEFQHLPATVSQMYFPEIFGRTEGNLVTVVE